MEACPEEAKGHYTIVRKSTVALPYAQVVVLNEALLGAVQTEKWQAQINEEKTYPHPGVPSCRGPNTTAKRLFNAVSPFLTARAIGTTTAIQPRYAYSFGWFRF